MIILHIHLSNKQSSNAVWIAKAHEGKMNDLLGVGENDHQERSVFLRL